MTVEQLIAKLKRFPPQAPVVIDMMSECRLLDDDEPTLKTMLDRHCNYITYVPEWWDRERDGEPNLVQVCHFPGN